MPPSCTVCESEHRDAVDRELAAGRSMSGIARRHPPLSEYAVGRHRASHLSAALVAVSRNKEGRRARTLLSRVEGIVGEAEGILRGAKESGKVSSALAAIRELRGLYELLGRLTGELTPDQTVTVVNIQQDPSWIAIRSRMLAALVAYPEARAAVVAALLPGADVAEYSEPRLVGSSPVSVGLGSAEEGPA